MCAQRRRPRIRYRRYRFLVPSNAGRGGRPAATFPRPRPRRAAAPRRRDRRCRNAAARPRRTGAAPPSDSCRRRSACPSCPPAAPAGSPVRPTISPPCDTISARVAVPASSSATTSLARCATCQRDSPCGGAACADVVRHRSHSPGQSATTSSRVSPSHRPIDVSRSRSSKVASIPVRTATAEAVSRARCRSERDDDVRPQRDDRRRGVDRLVVTDRVQRDVPVALQPLVPVPVGLAVPQQDQVFQGHGDATTSAGSLPDSSTSSAPVAGSPASGRRPSGAGAAPSTNATVGQSFHSRSSA